jgi:hypothetical protein
MWKVVITIVAVSLGVSVASAVSLKELNLPRDPANLDGAIYGKTVYGMNLRAGPGKYFAVIGAVPAGAEVPVVGWISALEEEEGFWLRTWYRGQRGWLCAFSEGERLIERDGGPLFTLRAKENIEGNYFGKSRPEPGAAFEFVWLDEIYWFDPWGAGDVYFRVKYGGECAKLRAYREEEVPEERRVFYPKPPAPTAAGWTVDLEPEFLELNLTYDYERCDFDFTRPDNTRVCDGPGYEFNDLECFVLSNYILFVEGEWALVDHFHNWGWTHIGTEREPNIQIYRVIPYYQEELTRIKIADQVGVYGDEEKWVKVYDAYWPRADEVYVEFREPYFSKSIGKVKINEAAFYQPPEAGEPLCVKAAGEGLKWGWHETVILTYSFDVPDTLDRDAPFRISTKMLYEGSEEFEVDFNCNPPRGN